MEGNEIKTVGVVGAGIMGTGIAQVVAQHGFDVILEDLSEDILKESLTKMRRKMAEMCREGRIAARDCDPTIERIKTTTGLADMSAADLVVEAAAEDMTLKKQIFRELDRICEERSILATNTSILSPTEISSATKRSDRCLGTHFMNPVPDTRLVEIVPGHNTSERTIGIARRFIERLGKETIVAKESPGGVVSRIIIAMRNEAVEVLAEGVASAEEIDRGMRLACGFPMGPLELIDMVGVDLHVTNCDRLCKELGTLKFRPHPLLRKMVRAGELGRKSGKGFYKYESGGAH